MPDRPVFRSILTLLTDAVKISFIACSGQHCFTISCMVHLSNASGQFNCTGVGKSSVESRLFVWTTIIIYTRARLETSGTLVCSLWPIEKECNVWLEVSFLGMSYLKPTSVTKPRYKTCLTDRIQEPCRSVRFLFISVAYIIECNIFRPTGRNDKLIVPRT